MESLMAIILAMFAAMPLPSNQHRAESRSIVAPQKAEEKAPSEKRSAQPIRMNECNEKADGKKGDERRKFLTACLKVTKPSISAQVKTCNQEASDKNLKGYERVDFLSSCLKI
jgi:psiF repeat-containing protein